MSHYNTFESHQRPGAQEQGQRSEGGANKMAQPVKALALEILAT